jgi:hypothetical protein
MQALKAKQRPPDVPRGRPDLGHRKLILGSNTWAQKRQSDPRPFQWEDGFPARLKSEKPNSADLQVRDSAIKDEFNALVQQWRRDTSLSSSTSRRTMHPSFLRIITMRESVLPLIYRELKTSPGHWFPVLRAITGANPVAPEDAGRIDIMKAKWMRYLEQNGFTKETQS